MELANNILRTSVHRSLNSKVWSIRSNDRHCANDPIPGISSMVRVALCHHDDFQSTISAAPYHVPSTFQHRVKDMCNDQATTCAFCFGVTSFFGLRSIPPYCQHRFDSSSAPSIYQVSILSYCFCADRLTHPLRPPKLFHAVTERKMNSRQLKQLDRTFSNASDELCTCTQTLPVVVT
ncbi:hypothetical protein K503DRAFT_432183 [Rhizopogon vinicolor AM-OR11-026]|uniref:Uncharacterized protein n=1 Tax=Rhizopogon vinicolor AM-OR11-026 TaxID=1314800 RepID=A0A1B7NAP5_9AGAM|nr:hypothetical protein K503DRAFT_432183 [Rhizopogon vinicolor AM-OR11-026]